MRAWWMIVVLAGCGKKPARFEGELPVAFGDCASASVAFVSGPQPQAFKPEAAERATVAIADGAPTLAQPAPIEAAGNAHDPPSQAAVVPTVSIGQPNAQGELDKAIIRRYIKRHVQQIQYCYEKQLLAKPTLKGTVQAQFFIGPDGVVKAAQASGVDPEMASCIADVIKRIEFPKPHGGGGVQVNYPFTFHQADDKPPPPPPPPPATEPAPTPGSGTAAAIARQQAIDEARTAGILGSSALTPPPDAPAVPARPDNARSLFRLAPPAPGYRPGADNPLGLQRDAITECLRLAPKHAGAAVVELTYGANGAVTAAKASGLDDEATSACLVEAAKHAIQPKGAPAAQRCSLAYGTLADADVASLAIGKDGIQYLGKPVATTGDTPDLPALGQALAAQTKAAVAATSPLTVRAPIVFRPDPAAPMKLVMRAWRTVLGAGGDVVFAGLQDVHQPVVPVPFSTGTRWTRIKPTPFVAPLDDERVGLSIYLTKDRTWIGISRVNEFYAIDRNDTAKLESQLKDEKMSAFFADRTDIEIAADDEILWGDVVATLDLAGKVGFLDWTLAEPKHLAALPQP